MSARVGSADVPGLRAGSTALTRAYVGFDVVWEANPSPPLSDTFSGAFSYANWPGSSSGLTNVSGRLRLPASSAYPTASTGTIFDLTSYPIWVEVPTTPGVGTGTVQTIFFATDLTTDAGFVINNGNLNMILEGQATTSAAYSATTHRWLRLRISGGNLLWDTSPDNAAWTNRRSIAAPAWMLNGGLRMYLSCGFYGTESGLSPAYAEFDNVNV